MYWDSVLKWYVLAVSKYTIQHLLSCLTLLGSLMFFCCKKIVTFFHNFKFSTISRENNMMFRLRNIWHQALAWWQMFLNLNITILSALVVIIVHIPTLLDKQHLRILQFEKLEKVSEVLLFFLAARWNFKIQVNLYRSSCRFFRSFSEMMNWNMDIYDTCGNSNECFTVDKCIY